MATLSWFFTRIWTWPRNITFVSLLFFPVLVSLGLWQIDRAHIKEALIDTKATHASLPAITNQLPLHTQDVYQRRLELTRGVQWLPLFFLVDNVIHQGTAGVEVVQVTSWQDTVILVNRGWMAFDRNTPNPRIDFSAIDSLQGQVRPWPQPKLALQSAPRLEGEVNLVQNLNYKNIEAFIGRPVWRALVMLADSHPNALTSLPRSDIGLAPLRHYGYALQWFGLACALLALNLWVWWRHAKS